MYPTNNSAYSALSGIKLITKTMGHAETELTEGRVLMVMNSAGLIAPPVRGISQAFTWLLIGFFGFTAPLLCPPASWGVKSGETPINRPVLLRIQSNKVS